MLLLNTISIIFYLTSCLLLLRKYPEFRIFFGYVCLIQVWSVVSCYYNDLGIYNPELFEYSRPSFATSRLVLFYLIFNLGFFGSGTLFKNSLSQKLSAPRNRTINYSYVHGIRFILNVIVAIFLTYCFLVNYSFEFSIPNRVEIYNSLDQSQRFFLKYDFILIFMLAYFRDSRKKFQACDFLLILLLIYYVSIGHKFSGLVNVVVYYLTPIWAKIAHNNFSTSFWNKRYFSWGFLGAATVISLTLIHYGKDADDLGVAWQWLIDRLFAMQGHLWWAVDNQLLESQKYDSGHWVNELNAITDPESSPDDSVGMKYLMIKILGIDKASHIFQSGYLYTMGYPAILLVSFSFSVGLLIQFFLGCFFFALLLYLNYAITSNHFIRSVIVLSVIIPFFNTLQSGIFITFLTIGVALKILILVMIESKIYLIAFRQNNA